MKHYVIYIHGFGDNLPDLQAQLIQQWRLFGLSPVYSPANWTDGGAFEAKLSKQIALVDKLSKKGLVSVVGVSAGASMAMNLYKARKDKIKAVVFIAGKLVGPETVSQKIFDKYPAFRGSVFSADIAFKKMSSADKTKMLTMYALSDNTVPVRASKLAGVQTKRIFTVGHIPAIYTALIFYAWPITKFIKSRVK